MKNIVFATLLSLTATAAFANGASTDTYPNGFKPHGDLSSITREAPKSNIERAVKSDDSVKFVAADHQNNADNLYPADNFRARYANIH